MQERKQDDFNIQLFPNYLTGKVTLNDAIKDLAAKFRKLNINVHLDVVLIFYQIAQKELEACYSLIINKKPSLSAAENEIAIKRFYAMREALIAEINYPSTVSIFEYYLSGESKEITHELVISNLDLKFKEFAKKVHYDATVPFYQHALKELEIYSATLAAKVPPLAPPQKEILDTRLRLLRNTLASKITYPSYNTELKIDFSKPADASLRNRAVVQEGVDIFKDHTAGISGSTFVRIPANADEKAPPPAAEVTHILDGGFRQYITDPEGHTTGFIIAQSDGCDHRGGKDADGDKYDSITAEITHILTEEGARLLKKCKSPAEVKEATPEIIKTLCDVASAHRAKKTEEYKIKEMYGANTNRATLTIGIAFKKEGCYEFAGFSIGKTMFCALDTANNTLEKIVPARKQIAGKTQSIPPFLDKPLTAEDVITFNVVLSPTVAVYAPSDGVFDALPCLEVASETKRFTDVSLDAKALSPVLEKIPFQSHASDYIKALHKVAINRTHDEYLKALKEIDAARKRLDESSKEINTLENLKKELEKEIGQQIDLISKSLSAISDKMEEVKASIPPEDKKAKEAISSEVETFFEWQEIWISAAKLRLINILSLPPFRNKELPKPTKELIIPPGEGFEDKAADLLAIISKAKGLNKDDLKAFSKKSREIYTREINKKIRDARKECDKCIDTIQAYPCLGDDASSSFIQFPPAEFKSPMLILKQLIIDRLAPSPTVFQPPVTPALAIIRIKSFQTDNYEDFMNALLVERLACIEDKNAPPKVVVDVLKECLNHPVVKVWVEKHKDVKDDTLLIAVNLLRFVNWRSAKLPLKPEDNTDFIKLGVCAHQLFKTNIPIEKTRAELKEIFTRHEQWFKVVPEKVSDFVNQPVLEAKKQSQLGL